MALIHKAARIDSGVSIRTACHITRGATIADDVFLGAGSVVTRDVPAGQTVVGNPARARKA